MSLVFDGIGGLVALWNSLNDPVFDGVGCYWKVLR